MAKKKSKTQVTELRATEPDIAAILEDWEKNRSVYVKLDMTRPEVVQNAFHCWVNFNLESSDCNVVILNPEKAMKAAWDNCKLSKLIRAWEIELRRTGYSGNNITAKAIELADAANYELPESIAGLENRKSKDDAGESNGWQTMTTRALSRRFNVTDKTVRTWASNASNKQWIKKMTTGIFAVRLSHPEAVDRIKKNPP